MVVEIKLQELFKKFINEELLPEIRSSINKEKIRADISEQQAIQFEKKLKSAQQKLKILKDTLEDEESKEIEENLGD